MHQAALDFIRSVPLRKRQFTAGAVDLGGRETNGNARWVLAGFEWTVVDAVDGEGVDVVCDARVYDPGDPVDLVLFAEVAEHFPQWRSIIHNAYTMLKPNGTLIVTAAGPGREVHGLNHDDPLHPGWYRNVDEWELAEAFALAGFTMTYTETLGEDVRGWAVR